MLDVPAPSRASPLPRWIFIAHRICVRPRSKCGADQDAQRFCAPRRQQARLLLALERIAVGEKIIDIAGELGYDSPSAFTTMFKKQFGKTPSDFFK
jgi:AraC-like DNA-binding protein